jgi:hypothetical protein
MDNVLESKGNVLFTQDKVSIPLHPNIELAVYTLENTEGTRCVSLEFMMVLACIFD